MQNTSNEQWILGERFDRGWWEEANSSQHLSYRLPGNIRGIVVEFVRYQERSQTLQELLNSRVRPQLSTVALTEYVSVEKQRLDVLGPSFRQTLRAKSREFSVFISLLFNRTYLLFYLAYEVRVESIRRDSFALVKNQDCAIRRCTANTARTKSEIEFIYNFDYSFPNDPFYLSRY